LAGPHPGRDPRVNGLADVVACAIESEDARHVRPQDLGLKTSAVLQKVEDAQVDFFWGYLLDRPNRLWFSCHRHADGGQFIKSVWPDKRPLPPDLLHDDRLPRGSLNCVDYASTSPLQAEGSAKPGGYVPVVQWAFVRDQLGDPLGVGFAQRIFMELVECPRIGLNL
jgi:hypothetical protein